MVFGRGTSPPPPSLGALGPQDDPPGGGGVGSVPTVCHQARSEITITVNMSGGPNHQIQYCWDEALDQGRGDGDYAGDGWVTGEYQHRWTRSDDQYEGKFSVQRKLLTEPNENTGDCGDIPGSFDNKCPYYECCCNKNADGTICGDGTGATTMFLSWEIFEYTTPAPVVTGKKPQGPPPALRSIQEGSTSLNLCKPAHLRRLANIKERVALHAETKEIHINAFITSRNTKEKCFYILDNERYRKELEEWLGGTVDGDDVWTEVKEICDIDTISIANIGGYFAGVVNLLCSRLTGGRCYPLNDPEKGKKGVLGEFKLGRKMPTGCPKPKAAPTIFGVPAHGGSGPSNYYAVRLYGANRLTNRVLHPKSKIWFWEHGESGNPEFGNPEGDQGSRENILKIIEAVINNPVNILCGYHRRQPMEILNGMGRYGKQLLCQAIKIKTYENTSLGNDQPLTIGMAWCLSAVRRLLGG